jgi:HK97 family phage portal protein
MVWPFSKPQPVAPAAPEKKYSSVGTLIATRALNLPQWPQRQFEQIAKEGYQQNPIVNACVYMVARAAANIPLEIKRGEEEVDVPDLAALLNRPNPMQDGEAFRIATLSDLLLAGEFFAEKVEVSKRPKELYRINPGRMTVDPGPQGFPASYTYNDGKSRKTFPVDVMKGILPILHVKEYNPNNDWRGMPNIDPAAFAIDMHTGALRWNNALLNNGAQPSGALVYAPKEGGDKLTEDQWQRLKAELDESFSGQKNAGKPILLDGGLDWREMGFSPKDMNFGEGLHESARLIALAFGVPPLMLGIPGDNTYSNYTEANKAFYRQTVIPLLHQWCRAFSWWIGPAYGADLTIYPDCDDLEVFAGEREAQWQRIEQSNSLTINEKRERMGLEPVPGGDVVLVPSSMVPLEVAGTMPDGGPEPQDVNNGEATEEETNIGGNGEDEE